MINGNVSGNSTPTREAVALDLNEYEILDAVPLPVIGDRLVRLRTIEEAIEDLLAAREARQESMPPPTASMATSSKFAPKTAYHRLRRRPCRGRPRP